MIHLSREIRFSLTPSDFPQQVANSWAGWPSTTLLAPFLVLRCCVSGEPDTQTGYVCNVQDLDRMLREILTDEAIPKYRGATTEQLLLAIYRASKARWQRTPHIVSMTLAPSPYLEFNLKSPSRYQNMDESKHLICLTEQFEFSAAHRLHCHSLSAEENRATFGKCNNPQGHGHNYIVEVSVEGEVDADGGGQLINLHQFESTVKRRVIDRLDHKHLNHDVDYFADVNPSVEHIAIAIWRWLVDEIEGATLSAVRVYETPKTWAEYRGK